MDRHDSALAVAEHHLSLVVEQIARCAKRGDVKQIEVRKRQLEKILLKAIEDKVFDRLDQL